MHNVTGFMVGKKTEREGLIKSGSLFVDAVSRSRVPHLSVICGASYGAGNYAVDPHLKFLIDKLDVWTSLRAKISFQLAGVTVFGHGTRPTKWCDDTSCNAICFGVTLSDISLII